MRTAVGVGMGLAAVVALVVVCHPVAAGQAMESPTEAVAAEGVETGVGVEVVGGVDLDQELHP